MSVAEESRTNPGQSAQTTSWQVLSMMTFNAWFGLRERGILRMKPLEQEERRERRYQIMLHELRKLQPDVVAIQEANPLPHYSRRLAGDLGYDEIHQVYNGGVKIGPVGIPINLRMGLVLLAAKGLNLRWAGSRQISGDSWGVYHDLLCFHFTDSRFVMGGSISVGRSRIFVIHTHTYAGPSQRPDMFNLLHQYHERGEIGQQGFQRHLVRLQQMVRRQQGEFDRILAFVESTCGSQPAVLLGDFNLDEDDPLLIDLKKRGQLWDTYRVANPQKDGYTWDGERNENTAFLGGVVSKRPGPMDIHARLRTAYDKRSRRIDYIFLNSAFREDQILASTVVLDHPLDGLHASDHYGVMTRIRVMA
jgi:hypothetical protein